MLVGKKTCRLKKKCRLENFPCQNRTCPECPEFPVMQDRKTAEAGKNALGEEKKKKSFSIQGEKIWLEEQNVGWKKNLSAEKQNVGWRISPAKNGHVRNVQNSL